MIVSNKKQTRHKNQNRCPGYHIKPSLNRQIDTTNVSFFYITKTNTIIGMSS